MRASGLGARGCCEADSPHPSPLPGERGQHLKPRFRPHFTQADAHRALPLAVAADDQRVAVFKESALLSIGQRDRLLAALREFYQRAGFVGLGARERAGAQQVARLQVAAVHRVVRDELRGRPVGGFGGVAAREPRGRFARGAHLRGLQQHFERDVQRAAFSVRGRIEVSQRLRVSRGPLEPGAERRQRFHRHDPWRQRAREVLREKRAERLVFPGLQVARRPVVEQRHAEQMLFGLADGNRLAERIAAADEEAQLQLVVEPLRRAEAGLGRIRCLGLPLGALEDLAAHADRRRTAVIADGHPLVVGHQRLVGAEQLADGGGVVNAGVEVGVVADAAGHGELGPGLRQQRLRPCGLFAAAFRKARRDGRAKCLAVFHAGVHQRVHVVGIDQACRLQVEHLVADGHPDAKSLAAARRAKAAEGQVLDRKVAAGFIGRGNPAAQLRVMGGVECGHGMSFFGCGVCSSAVTA